MGPENIIYIAIHKRNGKVMSGTHGQYAYENPSRLNKSMVHAGYVKDTGKKVRDLYDIYKLNVDTMTKELVE